MMHPSFIVTCEHAGNEVPDEFMHLFQGATETLLTHRGWDPGAFNVAEFLAENLDCSLHSFPITRLLIEANRSIESPQLFSEFSKDLSGKDKLLLINEYYYTYREGVENEIKGLRKPSIHLSVHSFTPVWNGVERTVDVGLLFDPSRKFESMVCQIWKKNAEQLLPGRKIVFNEPYQGTDDGFTTFLRSRFPDEQYAGIEIEINQKYNDTKELIEIQSALLRALVYSLQ